MLIQANKGNQIPQCWENAEVADQALRRLKEENSQEEVTFGLLVQGREAGVQLWDCRGVSPQDPWLSGWTDSARLSIQSFCCSLLIQSRAQGVIYCERFKLSLQYYKSFSFVSFVSLSDISSPLIVVPYSSLILMGFEVFSRFFP